MFMRFRPCIDIHNGRVKQIVGSSLMDKGDKARENFVSDKDSSYYATLYKQDNLKGGHIIMLNSNDSQYSNQNKNQAILATNTYPFSLQVGGGITNENASFYLENKASHVIVTSFVFKNGTINMSNLDKLIKETGKEKLVLDLSCRKKGDDYYIVTDRWQNFTDIKVCKQTIIELSSFCDEFLIHAVDVEGSSLGLDKELLELMAQNTIIPAVYAGGISSFDDIELIKNKGSGKIDFTIGSSLDIFGGKLSYKKVSEYK